MMGEYSTSEMENLHRVSKIHFLVHPGFLSDYRTLLDGDIENGITVQPEDDALLDKYVEQANKLKNDEIMVALTHTPRSDFKKDIKLDFLYIKNLQKIKDILGKRLIVLSDDFDIFEGAEAMRAVENLAKKRGYTFDQNVLTEAYGETLSCCVDDAAQNFNEAGNFSHKTKIRPELSVLPSHFDKYKKETLKDHPRIDFD